MISLGCLPRASPIWHGCWMSYGAVISTSHNPFRIQRHQIFLARGVKLPDSVEAEIEERVNSTEHLDHPFGEALGRRLPEGDAA